MDLGIAGRVALVTGASSGIGEAVALALAAEGVKLALAARRTDKLDGVAARARAAGAKDAAAFALDWSDESSIARTFDAVRAAFGEIDIFVLNGGGPKPGQFTDLELADWDVAYRTQLRAMIEALERVLPAMRANRWGRIVALTSTSVKQPIAGIALSNAFRTALVSTLKTIAGDVARDGVTVNAIATGRIATDRLLQVYGNEVDMTRAAEAEVPIGRVATPEEFAPLVAFLCGAPAGYVTGQTISIDGGLVRGIFG